MKNLQEFFTKNHLPLEDKKILLAVSGGPDSMALLDLMRQSVKDPTIQLCVGHLDHQLRSDSYQESKVISQYCNYYNLQLIEKKWPKAEQPTSGIEAAARNYRYSFLRQIVLEKEIDYLLTAHHGDDLIENILLKLIRSGNVQEMNSLVQIGNFEDTQAYLLRPLLQYSKTDLLRYVNEHHLTYIQDKTNFEDNTLRNRLRHHVVPLLKSENQNLIENANRFQTSETQLAKSQITLFGTFPSPKRKYSTWTGRLSDLHSLNLTQKRLYFEWLALQKFHQHVHFDELEDKPNIHQKKTGIVLILYQDRYYIYLDKEYDANYVAPFKVGLEKIFTFKRKKYIISRQNLPFIKIGDFYGKENLTLKVGSLPLGQKLLLANGSQTKAKKKFAESGIPNVLRSSCLAIMAGDESNEVQYIMDVYSKQTYDPSFVKYSVYEI